MHRALAYCLAVLSVIIIALPASAQQWVSSIPNRACYSVAVNPLNPSIAYVGNVARMMFKTSDAGTTWDPLTIGDNGPGDASLITVLIVHPRDTSVLLAGGLSFKGLDRSTDGGQSWTNVLKDDTGPRFEVASSAAVTINTAYPDTMYVMRLNPSNLYRSINAGVTWDSVGAIVGLPSQARIRALTMAPDSSNILLAGGRMAFVQRSTDHGKTWVTATNDLAGLDAEISNFVWSPSTPGKVYATAIIQSASNGGLHQSTDWGLTWTSVRFKDTSLQALAVQPTASGDEIFVGGNLLEQYTNPNVKGDSLVYRTVNGGTNWQSLDSVPWMENETGNTIANVWGFAVTFAGQYPEMLMATESGLFRSTYVTSVNERSVQSTTQPPTITVIGNELHMNDWQGAKGAYRVDIISLTGATLASIPCESGQQQVALPHSASGCYIIRAVGASESTTNVVILGN